MLGIFDSGIGGLTVVRELLKRHPEQSFIYLGDTARVPYGNKSREVVKQYAFEEVTFLRSKSVTDIIIACNTTSSVVEEIRGAFPDIRFFDVITPAAEAVIELNSKKIGVIGTRATIASGVYNKAIRAHGDPEIISIACPLFVPLVEEGWINKPETKKIVRRYLAPLKQKQIDALILGCTHYPLLQKVIRDSLQRRVKIIDSPSALLDQLEKTAPKIFRDDQQINHQQYFLTDTSPHTVSIASRWLGKSISVEKVDL